MQAAPSSQGVTFRDVPNIITGSRLVLSVLFFVMLSFYQYKGRGDLPNHWLLHWASIIYVVALITDFLDGYLARKWQTETTFGRIVDPFCDKVLVLGTFIFFAGKNFIIPDDVGGQHDVVKTITGVAPGIVVILLSRELLITSIRGASEGSGKNFGAAWSGKVKMGFQSATILIILIYVNYYDWFEAHAKLPARVVRDVGIWGTVAITLYSGLLYVGRAIRMYRQEPPAHG